MHPAEYHLESLYQKSCANSRAFNILRGIDFCSNDYLSLKSYPPIKQEFLRFLDEDPQWCSTGSRLVSGSFQAICKLEADFAKWVKRPCSLFFANGYQANLSVISTLLAGCRIFSDESNHASIIDAIQLSRSEKYIFRHNDLDHLEHLLRNETTAPRAIVTESLFSASGDFANIDGLLVLAEKYRALLVVDEAHATGVFGKHGAGFLSTYDSVPEHIITTHSCGKALASCGGFVACSEKVGAIIKNASRSFICTTAPAPYIIAHVSAMLKVLAAPLFSREALFANIAHAGGILETKSPIICVPIHDDDRAVFIKNTLAQAHFDVAVFRYPSVKKGCAQLRITLHSANTKSQIDELCSTLERLL